MIEYEEMKNQLSTQANQSYFPKLSTLTVDILDKFSNKDEHGIPTSFQNFFLNK